MAGKEEKTGAERGSLDATLDEHHECMRLVADVEACLGESPDREGRWIGRLLPRLHTLTETLRAHFCQEEQAALYREVPEKFPQFAERLERLAAEHGEIMQRATELLGKAGSLDHSHIHSLREFNAGAQLLIAAIRRHEAEENEVVLSAHWQEYGAGD